MARAARETGMAGGGLRIGAGRPRGTAALAALLAGTVLAGAPAQGQTIAQPGRRGGPTGVQVAQAGSAFAIPAAPLGAALEVFAAASGVQVLYDSGLTAGRSSPGVSGALASEAALARLLAGTGLRGRFTGPRAATLEREPQVRLDAGLPGVAELPPVDVTAARGAPSIGTIGQPPPPYAGGQVSSGARLGMLGNRNVFDTPFSITSYTDRLNEDQQSRSLADVVANDPAVRSILPRGSLGEQFFIRGFRVFPSDIAFDGLFGLASFRRQPIEGIERVEVLRGPSALLSGVPANGSIGGSINLIPKRAAAQDLTRLTVGFVSPGQIGTHIDIGRRFGANQEWGVRFNGAYRDGDAPVDNSRVGFGMASLGLDYRGERVRLSADLGYHRQDIEGIQNLLTVRPGFAIPNAPRSTINNNQPWENFYSNHYFAATRAEYDIASHTTVYAAFGWSEADEYSLTGSPQVINARGDFLQSVTANPAYYHSRTAEVGSRSRFETGSVSHQVTTALTGLWRETGSNFPTVGSPFAGNIYAPTTVPERFATSAQRQANLSARVENRGVALANTLSILEEHVSLTLGGRLQSVSIDNFNTATGVQTSSTSRSEFSPAVGLVVKPTSRLSLYANYIEGLQAGSVAPAGTVNAGQVTAPFVSRQVEIGAKYDFGDVGVTLAAFQVTQPSAFTNPSINQFIVDGEQRNRGLEFNVFGAPAAGLRLLGGITYTQGELTSTAGGVNNGKTAPGVPEMLLNLYGEYDLPFDATRGLTLTGRVIHTTSQYYDQANTQQIPSWTRTDLGARYVFDRPGGKPVALRFTAENVFGADYYASTAGGFLTRGAPRTYLLSMSVDF